MVKLDSLFLIGSAHQENQDYALTGTTSEGISYVIVSDGCSSSKNSDLGARIIALSARQYICKQFVDNSIGFNKRYIDFGNLVIHRARRFVRDLEIDISCLDATLLVVLKNENQIFVYCYGDGSVITQNTDDVLSVRTINFDSGAPFYLNYWADHGRSLAYKAQYNGDYSINIDNRDPIIESYDTPIYFSFIANEISMVAISTDGISSFYDKKNNTPVTVDNLVGGLFCFKNTNGEFLKRRVSRHVESLSKSGIVHHDDLGVAAMLLTSD